MSDGRISARKDASNVIVSTGPDVCWTPVGASKKKVAYSSIAYMSTAVRVSTSVRNNGNYDFQLNSRCRWSKGHKPGTLRGVKKPGYCGPAHVEIASDFFFSEGFANVSHGDPAWINRHNVGPKESQEAMGEKEF